MGPHNIVVPLDKEELFQRALKDLPVNERVRWTRHKIKPGQSLGGIAQHYKTTIAVIKQANSLKGNTIRARQTFIDYRLQQLSQAITHLVFLSG